ncbi:Pleckstrin domain [Trinorchestia longiramus]|nr:Pleckstrin domain [Trinorchestia longiramus]
MAEVGGFRQAPAVRPRENVQGSPSTGSDEGAEQNFADDFDPFGDPDEPDEVDSSLAAPPEESWYHGRLDRAQSEDRLRTYGKMGAYLVRESDRRPGSYVLSYYGRSGISHFKITAVCGDFYIGGRQFSALSDLVGYYTCVSDLLKRERLQHPVPPPEPVYNLRKVVAILPYTKMADTDELGFQKGDIFFVHNELSGGWLWVTAHRTGEQGTIFADLVENLDQDIDPNVVFSWFHSDITKNEAIDLLIKAGPGSFLVRPSDNSPGDYTLFFLTNNIIQRFRIEKRGVKYMMGGRSFSCLDAVINRYKSEQILEGHCLGAPVCKSLGDRTGLPIVPVKEVEQPEKIYATLNEIREKLGVTKFKGIQKQGWLYKKSKKNKKWKCLYFVLTDILYFYDNPKRTKPRGLIDLNCSYMYQVHDSFFERPHCFQLVERELPCISTVTYLCSDSQEMTCDWMAVLRPLCVPQTVNAPKLQNLKFMKSLQLTVLQAARLPSKLVPMPYCLVSLNQVKVCRTRAKASPDPVWEEEFVLDDIPEDVIMFTITVYNAGKRSRDSEMAEVTIELSSLRNGEEVEEWHPLTGITPVGEWGAVRLRYRYFHDLMMASSEYNSLRELLLDPNMEAVLALSDLTHRDRAPLAQALLRIFRGERREHDLLQKLCEHEIEREAETSTLFRAASLTTALMDLYMKATCTEFLQAAVSETLQRILETRQSCELNPTKMDNLMDACANAEFLLMVLDEIARSIFASAADCPMPLRYICSRLQRQVLEKWPNERLVKTRVVSGFIFLRLLCPAILNPRQFGLMQEPPPPAAARSLVMIAKCLQNLANLVEFGGKEPNMEVVNPFILKNKERMICFLDTLSSITERPEICEVRTKGDPSRDLAQLHHICVMHLPQLTARARSQPTLKKLVTVTEMLQKHKERYQEMMQTAAATVT